MQYGFEVVAAKPKGERADTDQPAQVPMRPAGIRSAPSTDQKKARRQMARKSATTVRHEDGGRLSPEDAQFAYGHAADYAGTDYADWYASQPFWYAAESLDDLPNHGTTSTEWSMTARASKITPEKESPMTSSREASILQAMAVASLSEQRVLAAELADLRRSRTASVVAERESDLADTVVRAHLTPIRTHALNTTATDWLGEVPVASEDATMAMKTQASLWFQRTSSAVKDDREEFVIQAEGMAARLASSHGDQAPVAERAFLDQVGHLYRVAADTANAESTITDYDTKADDEPYLAEDWDQDGDMGHHPAMPGAQGARKGPGPSGDDEKCPKCHGKGWTDWPAGVDMGPMSMPDCTACGGTGIKKGAAKTAAEGDPFGEEQERIDWLETRYDDLSQPDAATISEMDPDEFEDYMSRVEGSKRTASEGGATCASCGASIERDPAGEEPRTWHHNDGASHDHEAKPSGGEAKESSLQVTAQARPLYEIAEDIRANWPNVYFGAVPYLDAMSYLNSINDNFGEDSGRLVVAYFLSNTKGWRGPEAARLKAELKSLQARRSSRVEAGSEVGPKDPAQGESGLPTVEERGEDHPEGAFPWEIGETQGFVSGASLDPTLSPTALAFRARVQANLR